MKMFRNNEICVDNETQFYIGLRRKQVIGTVEGAESITNDEVANADLRNLYTNANPSWVEAWGKREQLRQKHNKDLVAIENEAVSLSPRFASSSGFIEKTELKR